MKKRSKKLLALLMALAMVFTTVPTAIFTAYAYDDAESRLVAALESFENDVMMKLGTEGYDAIQTKLYDAYQAYYVALQIRQDGTAEEMDEAREYLEDARAEMQDFVEPTANTPVKIGTAESQPTSDDYSNVLYSDGETNAAFTNTTKGATSQYGTTGILGINWEYENYYYFYFPNTVILYDGKTNPKIPVVVGVSGNTSGNATLMPQNIYLNSDYFEIDKDWEGTTEGGRSASSTRFTNPTWPDLDLNGNGGSHYLHNISYIPARRPYDTLREYNNGRYRWAYEGTSSKMAFRNSMVYSLAGANEPEHGYSTVDSVTFMGEGSYCWHVTDSWSVKGYRGMEPCVYTYTKTRVLNYKLIRTNLQALIERNAENFQNLEYIRSGALMDIARVIQLATEFDPYGYDYASDMVAAAEEAGKDIDNIVAKLMTATLDDVDAIVATLDNVIDKYVAMMAEKKVYTNMLYAYKLYQTAVEYRDALKYGRRPENTLNPTISDLVYDFDMAMKDMKEVGTSNAYNYVASAAFDGDNSGSIKTAAYRETFKNLIYAGHTPTRMRSWGGETEGDTGNGVFRVRASGGGFATSHNPTAYFYIPKAVAVYDGTNGDDSNPFTVPVLLGYNVAGGIALQEGRRSAYGVFSNTEDLPFLYNWKTRTFAGQSDVDDYVPEPGTNTNYYVFDVNCKVQDGLKTKWNQYNPTRTYIQEASLNDILNVDSFADAKDAIGITTTFDSATTSLVRNNHQGDSDDPENFYANVMRIKNPYTDSTKTFNTGWKYYYYKYTSMSASLYACDVADNICIPSSKGTQRNQTGSTNNLDLYVINYKPVLDRVHGADGLLTDEPLDITKFTEGGLEGYFEDMDKLTSCSPNNTKRYEFDNDNYQTSDKFRLDDLEIEDYTANANGYVASTEQCAYDIWALLDSDTDEALQHMKDDDGSYTYTDDQGVTHTVPQDQMKDLLDDSRNSEGGDYSELKGQLDEKSEEEWAAVGTCQSGVYWNAYEAAVNAGRQLMSNVANPIKNSDDVVIGHNGYDDQTITYTYKDDDDNDITVNVASVEEMAQKIDETFRGLANAEKRTRHTVKFDHRAGPKTDRQAWDTGVFICNADNSHKWLYKQDWEEPHPSDWEHNTADMGVYDALQFAYTTIDFERYDNDYIIESGKTEFDKVLTDVGAPGVEPQDMVDAGITRLLTAISDASTTEHSVTYPVELDIIDVDGDTVLETLAVADLVANGVIPADICKTVDGEPKEVLYGSTFRFDVSSFGKVYKWEIWTDNNRDGEYGDCNTKFVKDGNESGQATTTKFELAVQSAVRVVAYLKPEVSSDSEVLVQIQNQYGKPVYYFAYDKNAPVAVDNDNGTLTIGVSDAAKTFDISDDLFKIPNYTIKGFNIEITDTKNTLKDFANDDGIVEIPVKYELTNKNKTFTLTYNGRVIREDIQYDEKVHVASNAGDDFVAIAIKNNTGDAQVFDYLPISYTKSFDYFAVCDLELVDITSPEMTQDTFNMEHFYITTADGQEELDLNINPTEYDDMDYFRFAIERRKTKMPFVYAVFEKIGPATEGRTKYAVHSYFTNITKIEGDSSQAAKFVEAGTVFTTNAATAADRNAFKEGEPGVITYKADKRLLDSYYYITANARSTVYARSYVKYKYQFVNSHDEGASDITEIEAVIYGDVVNSVDNDNGVYVEQP